MQAEDLAIPLREDAYWMYPCQMTDSATLRSPFDELVEGQKQWGGIWDGSWFFGLAVARATSEDMPLVLGRIILRTPGVASPNLPSGCFLKVPGAASGLMMELNELQTRELMASLSSDGIPQWVQEEFGEKVVLPGIGQARWHLSTDPFVRGEIHPRVRLERRGVAPLHELVGHDRVQRIAGALRSRGVSIDGWKELAQRLRCFTFSGESPQMEHPSFEISPICHSHLLHSTTTRRGAVTLPWSRLVAMCQDKRFRCPCCGG